MKPEDDTQPVASASDKEAMQTRSVAHLGWARQVGESWRPQAEGLPDAMIELLSVALGGELRSAGGPDGPEYRDALELCDRAIAVAAILEGQCPRWLEERAAKLKRSEAFAVAAACAVGAAERDPDAFSRTRRLFLQIQEDFQDGTTAGLLNVSGRGRGPVYQQAQRRARTARAAGESWTTVLSLRAERGRLAGRRDALAGAIDEDRSALDSGYRLGAYEGSFVRSAVPEIDVSRELASITR